MLYKGKHAGYYLYELTQTDLMWEESPQNHYCVGNVLLFANKKNISLGSELVKADDLTTALDYLEGDVEYVEEASSPHMEVLSALRKQLSQSEAKVLWLDGLLHDLTADLDSQIYSNKMLIAQLESLREQVSIEKLSRDEVIEDLEFASAETYRKDQELQEAIDAKSLLEQELAARICELLELDSAHLDLQKRLEERSFDQKEFLDDTCEETNMLGDSLNKLGSSVADPTGKGTVGSAQANKKRSKTHSQDAQVFTTPSGKQIHVYHEFPVNKSKKPQRGISAVQGALRVVGYIVLGLVIFVAGSVLATAQFNELSLGEALDMTLKTIVP